MAKERPIKCLCITLQDINIPVLQATLLSLLTSFPKDGYEFRILSFKNYSEFNKSKQGVQFVNKINFSENINILTVLGISFKYNTLLALFMGFILQLRYGFDLIYARDIWSGLVGYFISKLFRRKFFFDHRGLIAEETVMRGKAKKTSIKYQFMRLLELYLVNNADIATCVSIPILNYFKKNGIKNSIIHMPNCIKQSRFKNIGDKKNELKDRYNLNDRFIVSFIGGYVEWYDIDYTISIFKLINEKINNSLLLIITYKIEIWEKIMRNHYHFSENDYKVLKAPFELTPEYLNIIDLGILFIKMPNGKYCFPIKFAEYLAAGVPVLTTKRVRDVSDFIENYDVGFVFNNMNEFFIKRKFYKYLDFYIANKDAIRENCKKVAFKELEWSKYAGIIDDRLKDLFKFAKQ